MERKKKQQQVAEEIDRHLPDVLTALCVSYCPLGHRMLATACQDGVVCVFDFHRDGDEHIREISLNVPVAAVCLTFDGDTAYVGLWGDDICGWDMQTGKKLCTLVVDKCTFALALSPDEQTLFSGFEDGLVWSWDLASGKCSQVFSGHTLDVNSICVASDASFIVTDSDDKSIRVWDTKSGEYRVLDSSQAHSTRFHTICLSHDDRLLYSCGSGDCVRVWDLQTDAEVLPSFQGHSEAILDTCLSPNDNLLFTASRDNTVRVWDVKTRACVRVLAHSRSVDKIFYRDRLLISVTRGGIQVWDLNNYTVIRSFKHPNVTIWVAALGP